ncbi:MAG: VCBS repeat-containing protein [Desulfamplus sp.]|nr:VCBS repeat-containing protein [Desulfamplus sp.]
MKIAILPFEINAQQNLDFLKNGIQDMLTSRLSFKDQIKVIEKESVYKVASDTKGFTGESFALLVGGKLKADFVIHGSVTIIGNSTSIDSKLIDISGKNQPISFFKQSSDPSGVIPAINQFATTINETIFNRNENAIPHSIESTTPQPAIQPLQSQSSKIQNNQQQLNSNFVINNQTQPSSTIQQASPNPEFAITNNVRGKSGAWKSQAFKHLINGIAVADTNKDNIMETIFISDQTVYIYRFLGNRFLKTAEIGKNRRSTYISVDVGDINQNGIQEIFVTSLNPDKNMPNSFVIEYDGTNYVNIIKNIPWYFKIVDTKIEGKILIGQKQKSEKDNIYGSQIYKMSWDGEKYVPSKVILESGKANVLGSLFEDIIGDNTAKIVAYDKAEHLTLFNQNGGVIWRDVNRSGGNMNYFILPKESPTDDQTIQYFPLPVRSADVNGDGSMEILYASNNDIVGGYLSKFKRYSKGGVHCAFWNSTGFSLQWSTPEHTGRISDFVVGDFDNDGAKELVLVNVIKDAFSSFTDSESLITAYDLMQ